MPQYVLVSKIKTVTPAPPSGNTYYVDAVSGLDSNNGKSTSTAWQTLGKVGSSSFNAGDSILLKCGQTWTNQALIVPSSGASGSVITFGNYGTGSNPLIDGSQTITGWSVYSGAIYRASLSLSANAYQSVFQDSVRLIYESSAGAMITGSFYNDGSNYLYVWMTDSSNPSSHTIKIASISQCVDTNYKSYLTFNGIDTTMANLSGYDCRRDGGHDITVMNCTSSWATQRNFNAGAWTLGINHDRVVFQNCTAHDSVGEGFWAGYGNGCGMQNCTSYNNGIDNSGKGYSTENAGSAFTIGSSAINCFVKNCVGYDAPNGSALISIEYVAAEGNQPTGTVISANDSYRTNCDLPIIQDAGAGTVIMNNTLHVATGTNVIIKLGSSAGAGIACVTPMIYNNTFSSTVNLQELIYAYLITNGCSIENNIYDQDGGSSGAVYVATGGKGGFTADYNEWGPINSAYWYGNGFVTFANWKTDSGQDSHSRTDASPMFVGGTNYHLQAGSPCKGAGVTIALVTVDKDGNTRASPPSIGAYE